MRLENKVAIITGAGSGIGRAMALRLSEEGAKVVVDDINPEAGEDTVSRIKRKGGEALFIRADVSQSDEVDSMVKAALARFGSLHILINNAIPGNVETAENSWDPTVSVGLKGCWLTMQAVIPVMRKAGIGSVVNISSVNALMGFGNDHVYSAAKAGIIGMSRSLVGEVGKFGIRINCICPGTIVTEIWKPNLDRDANLFDRLVKLYPIGRLGQAEDVANAALFLASDEASFVTGAVFVIDGGLTAANPSFVI